MTQKDKNIISLAYELENIEKDVAKTKEISACRASIIVEDVGNIAIWQHLATPLQEFLLKYYDKQKNDVYDRIRQQLNS